MRKSKSPGIRAQRLYVAVLGSGDKVSTVNLRRAVSVGRALAEAGFNVACGGLGGVFAGAFEGCRIGGGTSVGLVPAAVGRPPPAGCDQVLTTNLGALRHPLLADMCCGAVVIEGWLGTLALMIQFLLRHKPVVLFDGSGGVASTYAHRPMVQGMPDRLPAARSAAGCVRRLQQRTAGRAATASASDRP